MITKWESSGIPLKTFSNSVDVSYYKLKYWKYKFNQVNQEATEKRITSQQYKPDFIPVELPNAIIDFTGLELSFPNNVKLTCPSGIGLEELKTLIKLF